MYCNIAEKCTTIHVPISNFIFKENSAIFCFIDKKIACYKHMYTKTVNFTHVFTENKENDTTAKFVKLLAVIEYLHRKAEGS